MKVDMSPKGIAARLRQVAELNEICLALGKAGRDTDRNPGVRPPAARKERGRDKEAGAR